MELTDPKTIADLLASRDFALQLERVRPAVLNAQRRCRTSKVSPCRCGTCRRCRDNARWERIFQEKFADPDYYLPRPVRYSSPLW